MNTKNDTTPSHRKRQTRHQTVSEALGGLILAFSGFLLVLGGSLLLLPFSIGIALAWTLPRRGLSSWVGPLFCLALASLLSTRFGLDSLDAQKGAFLSLWQSQLGWFLENWPRYVTDGPVGLHFGSIDPVWAYFLLVGLPIGALVRKSRVAGLFLPTFLALGPHPSSVSPTTTTTPPTGEGGNEATTDNGVETTPPGAPQDERYTLLHSLFTRAEVHQWALRQARKGWIGKIGHWLYGYGKFGGVPPHLVPDTHLYRGIDRVFDDFHTRFWLSIPCKLRDTTPPSVYAPSTRSPGTHGEQVALPGSGQVPGSGWHTGNHASYRVPSHGGVCTWGSVGQVGSVELLVAPEKSGKTKLTVGLTNAQRTGAPFLGWPTVQTGAVHLVEESASMYDPKRREAMGLPAAPIQVSDRVWRHRALQWSPRVSRPDTPPSERLTQRDLVGNCSMMSTLFKESHATRPERLFDEGNRRHSMEDRRIKTSETANNRSQVRKDSNAHPCDPNHADVQARNVASQEIRHSTRSRRVVQANTSYGFRDLFLEYRSITSHVPWSSRQRPAHHTGSGKSTILVVWKTIYTVAKSVQDWSTRFCTKCRKLVLDTIAYDGGARQGGEDRAQRGRQCGWLGGILHSQRHLREMRLPTLAVGVPPYTLPSTATIASGASPQVVAPGESDWYTRSCKAIGDLYRFTWKWARVSSLCLQTSLVRLAKHRVAGLPAEERTQAKRIECLPPLLALLYGPTPGLSRALLPLTTHLAMACTIARVRSSLTGIPWYTIQIDSLFHWIPDAETDAQQAMAALQLFKAVASCGFLVRVVVHATPSGSAGAPGKSGFRVSGPQNIARQADILWFLEPSPASASPRNTTHRRLAFQGRFEDRPKPDDLLYAFQDGALFSLSSLALGDGVVHGNGHLSRISRLENSQKVGVSEKSLVVTDRIAAPAAPSALAPAATQTTQHATIQGQDNTRVGEIRNAQVGYPGDSGDMQLQQLQRVSQKQQAQQNLDLLLSMCPLPDQEPVRAALLVKQYCDLKQVQRDRVYTMAHELERQGKLVISFVPGKKAHQWRQVESG